MISPWQFLKKSAELGRIPHALLFYGPNNEEKMSAALEFVKLVNGLDALEGVRPDLVLVEPLSASDEETHKQEIKIFQIRELHSKLSLKSYSAPFKFAIINQAHALNQEAQSAFLKLLEEPKGQTIFILITEYPEMLLPTILSRTERLRFYSSQSHICPKEDAEKISKISRSDLGKRFQYAKELADDPQNLRKTLEAWLCYFREALLSDPDKPNIAKILKTIQNTHYLISTTNVNPRLALDILMLEF
ncbi:MAG: hypothetical protein HYW69_02565 [Candidatus Nealsonbacteria bacterium]|nr:hypothetical protein [Candidatus Nealsonbacteria bacterium]